MDKQQLTKLASLNNEIANKFLLNFALEKKEEIKRLDKNEDIIAALDCLTAFSYRTPNIAWEVCSYLLYTARPIKPKIIFGRTKGDSWADVQVKALELLRHIRYYELKRAIKTGFEFAVHPNQSVRSLAIKLLEEVSEYDYRLLPHVGLSPQISVFSYIKKNIFKIDFENNFNAFKVSIEKILETSADATIMTSVDTLTIKKADLNGGKNLAKLRKDCIDLIFLICKKSKLNVTRDKALHLLAYACQLPMNSSNDSDMGLIVQENRTYIISKLEGVILGKKGELKVSLAFCLEVEHFLYWHFIYHKQQDEIARPLYEKILKNPIYERFSKFVQDDSLRYEIGSSEQKKQNHADVIEYIKEISEKNLQRVSVELNSFATDVDVIGEWKFRNLQSLMENFGRLKPELALLLIMDVVNHKKPLSNQMFLAFLLRGIRLSEKYDIWDDAVNFIVRKKDINLIGSVPASLHIYADFDESPFLRKADFSMLEDLTQRKASFGFIKPLKQTINMSYMTMNALRRIYSLNPKKIESLIVCEMRSAPLFVGNHLQNLSLYSGREGGIDFSKWSNKDKLFIKEKIIQLPTIDWHIESLISNVCSNPVDVVRIFIARISKEAKIDKSIVDYFDRKERYEAIPFHMNNHLVDYVVNHKDYKKIITEIVKASRSKNSTRKFDLAKLNKHFNVSPYAIIEELTKKGKVTDKILREVLDIVYDFDGIEVDLAINLAGYTSNEKILEEIRGKLHNTGVVSGQYGIADSYKCKMALLEKHLNDKNENIRKFVKMALESLAVYEERSRKDADQDKEKRRIDFEVNS